MVGTLNQDKVRTYLITTLPQGRNIVVFPNVTYRILKKCPPWFMKYRSPPVGSVHCHVSIAKRVFAGFDWTSLCQKFAIFDLEMTLTMVAIKIVTQFCVLYDADLSFLSWAKFQGSTTIINGDIHNTMTVRPFSSEAPVSCALFLSSVAGVTTNSFEPGH